MKRRAFLLAGVATLAASPAIARSGRGGREGREGRTGREGRQPREPRQPRSSIERVEVIGLFVIGTIVILNDTGEECRVIAHVGPNSICEVLR